MDADTTISAADSTSSQPDQVGASTSMTSTLTTGNEATPASPSTSANTPSHPPVSVKSPVYTTAVQMIDNQPHLNCHFKFTYYDHIRYSLSLPLETATVQDLVTRIHTDWPYGDEVARVHESAIQILLGGKKLISHKSPELLKYRLAGM